MRLREWPPRRIALTWVIVMAAQLLAMNVAMRFLAWEHAGFRDEALSLPSESDSVPTAAARDTGHVPAITVTRTALATGDTLIRIERGGSFMEFLSSGETVRMSEDMERGASGLGGALAAGAERTALIPALIRGIRDLPLVILLAITLVWAFQRRLYPAS